MNRQKRNLFTIKNGSKNEEETINTRDEFLVNECWVFKFERNQIKWNCNTYLYHLWFVFFFVLFEIRTLIFSICSSSCSSIIFIIIIIIIPLSITTIDSSNSIIRSCHWHLVTVMYSIVNCEYTQINLMRSMWKFFHHFYSIKWNQWFPASITPMPNPWVVHCTM